MSRGKEAARNANRRAAEAEAGVLVLKERLARLKTEHAAELAELRAERDRARGELSREVRRLAAEEVERVKQQHLGALDGYRNGHLEKVAQGLALIEKRLPADHPLAVRGLEGWADIAQAFGVHVGPLIDRMTEINEGRGYNREVRRTTNDRARWKQRHHPDLDDIPLPPPVS